MPPVATAPGTAGPPGQRGTRLPLRRRTPYDKARELPPQNPIYDDQSPVIWVLDAGSLNAFSCKEDCVFTLGGLHSAAYLTSALKEKTDKNRYPIAILPAHTNERLAV
jgi:hypothetical protein